MSVVIGDLSDVKEDEDELVEKQQGVSRARVEKDSKGYTPLAPRIHRYSLL